MTGNSGRASMGGPAASALAQATGTTARAGTSAPAMASAVRLHALLVCPAQLTRQTAGSRPARCAAAMAWGLVHSPREGARCRGNARCSSILGYLGREGASGRTGRT